MEVDPRLLTSFVTLAEELHFGRAAARLHVSQPALSRQVRQLETQIGSPLFRRSTRSVEPTAAGRALLDPARDALRLVDAGVRAARAAEQDKVHLRIGVEIDLDDGLDWVRAFAAAKPMLQIFVSREHEPRGVQRLKEGGLDVFVGWVDAVDAELATSRAATVPLLAALHRSHPLSGSRSICLEDFRASAVAIFQEGFAPESFAYYVGLLSAGRPDDLVVLEVESYTAAQETMFDAVTGNSVVSFGAGEQARRIADSRDVVMLEFEPPIDLPTYVMWRRSQPPAGLEALLAEGAIRSRNDGPRALAAATG